MPAATVEWLPALAVLAMGLVVGLVLVRRVAHARGPAPELAAPVDRQGIERRDLVARRDALLEQLRELQGTAPEDAEAAGRRAALEVEAARTLRDLDRVETAPLARGRREAAPAQPPHSDGRERETLRGFVWGVSSATAVGLLIFLASRSTSERAPMGERAAAGVSEARGGSEADQEIAQLQEAVRANPDDLDARLTLARAALARQDMVEVYNQTRAVLERSPGHPRALSYQALVRLAMGQTDRAEQMLRQALATDPDLLEGYIHLSLVHLRAGRTDEAGADIKEAARRHPAQAEKLQALWAQMRAQSEAAPRAEGTGEASGADPHGTLPVPEGGSTAAGSGAMAADSIAGSIELAPGVTQPVGAGAVVFLTLRAPGASGGPPLAARRLSASSFPLSFSIGSADSMMGGSLPGRVRLEARVDADGDPLTRDPRDPVARLDEVRVGTKGVRLVLRPQAR